MTYESLAHKLMESFLRIKKINRNHSPVAGLKHSEIVLLFCINKAVKPGELGITISEIGHLLKVTSPTVTQLVNGLQKQELIERNIDKEDRRAVRIRLTNKGEKVIKKAWQTFLHSFTGLAEHLGEEKSRELVDLLTQVFSYFNSLQEANDNSVDESGGLLND